MSEKIYKKLLNYSKDFEESGVKTAIDYFISKKEDLQRPVEDVFAVVDILLPLKPDKDTLIAVLLYDFFLFGVLTPEKLKSEYGVGVFRILDSLRRLSVLTYLDTDKKGQIENLRKMFITLAKDVRVILIWLAQRLALMRRLRSDEGVVVRAVSVSKETMDVYVPIASRLGFYRMKTELEDLSFYYINPEEYQQIYSDIQSYSSSNTMMIKHVTEEIDNFLTANGINAAVNGRIKSIYSIYRKLKRKGLTSLTDLYDFYAIRVVLQDSSVDALYAFLGLLHSEWKPLSSRFKDYVAVPKPNGYRSLHTVLLGLGPKDVDKPVEIQIRNEEMHREAEYGFASHWIYKSGFKPQVEWLKGLKNLQEYFENDLEGMKGLELDVFKDRIFVLTPRGDIKDLPANSVPIDFAYSIHTDVGNTCVMAKVNSNIVPLDYELNNGDVVEIITKKESSPKLKWLSVVKTGFAKTKIKNWFNSQHKDNHLKTGRELMNAQLERLGKPLLDNNYSALKSFAGQNLTMAKRESLLEEVGRGSKMASDIVRKIYPYEKNLGSKEYVSQKDFVDERKGDLEMAELEKEVVVGEETGLPVRIASCCMPKLGTSIVGYVTRGNSVSIHRSNCKLLDNLHGERIIMARWKGQSLARSKIQVWIKLVVASRIGLIHDVSSVIAGFGINIADIYINRLGGGMNETHLLLDLDDLEKFDLLLDKLENVEGVMKAMREDRDGNS